VSFYSPEIPTVASPDSSGDYSGDSSNVPVDELEKGGWHPAVFWTGLTLTVIGVGVTTGLGIRAQNNPGKQAVIDNCEQNDRSCPEFKEGVKNQAQANI